MPDIIEPLVIRFSNEKVRPMAELLVAVSDRIDEMILTYNVQVLPLLGGNAGSDLIIDGRELQGVSALVLSDLQNLITQAQLIQTQFTGGGVKDVLNKPTVRVLNLSG